MSAGRCDGNGDVARAGATQGIVAGMVDRRDHEAGVGQSLGGIVMAAEPAVLAVRDHDQR